MNFFFRVFLIALLNLLAVTFAFPQINNPLIQQANEKLAKGDTAGALDNCGMAISINANDGWAYNTRGWIRNASGKHEEAIKDYNKAIEISPDYAGALFNRGVSKFMLGDYNNAIPDLDRSISLDPNLAFAYNWRANVKVKLKRFAEAIGDYSKCINLNPKFAFAYLNRGLAKSLSGDLAEAIADYNLAISVGPPNAYFYQVRGGAYTTQKKYSEALADYNKALEIDQTSAWTYSARSTVLFAMGRKDEAVHSLDAAIALYPSDFNLYVQKGSLKQKMGLYHEGLLDFYKAMQLQPRQTDTFYHFIAIVEKDLHLNKEALINCNKAIQLNPANPDYYITRGIIQKNLDHMKEALDDFQKVVDLNGTSSTAYNNIGFAILETGMYDAALYYLNKSIEFSPNNKFPIGNSAAIQFWLGNYEEALKGQLRTTRIDPLEPRGFLNVGMTYERTGRYDSALVNYNKAVSLIVTDYSDPYKYRGNYYCKAGLYQKALSDFTKAIELNDRQPASYNSRGYVYMKLKKYKEAINDYDTAVAKGKSYYQPFFKYREEAIAALSGNVVTSVATVEWHCPIDDVNKLFNGTFHAENTEVALQLRITSDLPLQQQDVQLLLDEKVVNSSEKNLASNSFFRTAPRQNGEAKYAYMYGVTVRLPQGESAIRCIYGKKSSQVLKTYLAPL